MLIHWGAEAKDQCLKNSDAFTELAQEVLRARRKGKHVVSVHPSILKEILKLNLSDIDISVAKRMIDEFTQVGGGIKTIRPAVRLVNSWDDSVLEEDEVVNVSLQSALEMDIFKTPVLLLENLKNDGFLYKIALKETSPHPIDFKVDHGGGGDIANVFEQRMTEFAIIACVVDSDKYSPLSRRNEKLAAINTRRKRLGWPLAFTLSPSCREVENMIPLKAILCLPCAVNHASNEGLSKIDKMETEDVTQKFWSYFDIKKGVVFGKLSKLSDPEFAWVDEKLSLADITVSRAADETMGENPRDYIYLGGYGDRVVDQVMRSEQAIQETVGSFNGEVWKSCFRDTIMTLQVIFSALTPVRA